MTKLGRVVRRGLAVSTVMLMPLVTAAQVADEPAYTVLTGIQATYSLATALTNGTSIQVVNGSGCEPAHRARDTSDRARFISSTDDEDTSQASRRGSNARSTAAERGKTPRKSRSGPKNQICLVSTSSTRARAGPSANRARSYTPMTEAPRGLSRRAECVTF